MIAALWRFLTGAQTGPETRLTAEEALAIATRASPDRPAVIAVAAAFEGRVIWRTWSAARGAARIVTIDDATGEVISVRDFAGR